MDTARFVESLHVGHERVSTIVCDRHGQHTSACAQGPVMASALLNAELARRAEDER